MAKKTAATEAGDGEEAKKGKKKPLMIVGLCLVLAGAGYKLGGGGAEAASTAPPTTIVQLVGCKEGTDATHAEPNVFPLDKMSLNLADGHYLSVRVSLNLCPDVVVAAAGEAAGHGEGAAVGVEFPTAPALDIIVSTLSGTSMSTLATAEGREEARKLLIQRISEQYEEQVYGLFFVEFVMQ